MKVQQAIEIKVAGSDNAAYAQIVMGAKRSAQKKFATLEAAKLDAEAMVAKYGSTISWTATDGNTSLKMIGAYELEAGR